MKNLENMANLMTFKNMVNTGNGKNVKNMNTLKQENGNRKITKSEIELKMNTKIFPFTTTSQYPSHKKDVNVISLVEFKALTQDSFKKEEYCLDPTEFSENFVSTSSIFVSLTEMMHEGTTYSKLAYDHQKITLLVMILNSLNNEVLLKLLENSLGSELPYLSNLLVEQFHAEIGLFCLFYIELLLPNENDRCYPSYRNLCFNFRRKVYNYLCFHHITPKMFWDKSIMLFKTFVNPDSVEYELFCVNTPLVLDLGPKIGHLAEYYSNYYITMRLRLKQTPTGKDMRLLFDDLIPFTEATLEEANDTTSIFCTHGVTFFYNYKIVNGVFKTRDEVDIEETKKKKVLQIEREKKKDAGQVVPFYDKGDQRKPLNTPIQVNVVKKVLNNAPKVNWSNHQRGRSISKQSKNF